MAQLLIYPESDPIEDLMAQAQRIFKQPSVFGLIYPDLDVAIRDLAGYCRQHRKRQLENYFSILDQVRKWENSL